MKEGGGVGGVEEEKEFPLADCRIK